jgi:hypothetical protein
MRLQRLLGVLLLGPGTALAQDIDYGSIDGYYVPQATFAARWPASAALDEEGNGFGVRVMSRVTDTVMVLGEAQSLSHDSVDTLQVRVGVGLATPSTSGVFLTYDRLALDRDDANALGVHVRAAARADEQLLLYGDAAYLGADGDSFYYDGFEFTAGAAVDLDEPWGFFLDYRVLLLEDRDNDDRIDLRQFRVGVRYRFDC